MRQCRRRQVRRMQADTEEHVCDEQAQLALTSAHLAYARRQEKAFYRTFPLGVRERATPALLRLADSLLPQALRDSRISASSQV